MIDYERYIFSRREWILEGIKSGIEILFLGFLFFRTFWGVVLLLPYGIWQWRQRKEEKKKERLCQLRQDFKEMILSVAFSLQAGYTLEQAISIARKDLERINTAVSCMKEELFWMEKRMQMGEPIEGLMRNLARRSGVSEIESYAEVLAVARKQGGNMVQISKEAAEHISGSIQVQMEIEQVLAGKNLEKKIMLVMPYFILLYLSFTNGSYLQPLYESTFGRLWMFLCLVLIFLAKYWADRIIDIRM